MSISKIITEYQEFLIPEPSPFFTCIQCGWKQSYRESIDPDSLLCNDCVVDESEEEEYE